MDHHVVPAAGGGSRAFLRVPGRSAPLLQPYRVPAVAALRGLVRDRSGLGAEEEPVESFDFAFTRSYALAGRPFGITPKTTGVEVGPHWLYVRYGPWRLLTPAQQHRLGRGHAAASRSSRPPVRRTCRSATAASPSPATATVRCA